MMVSLLLAMPSLAKNPSPISGAFEAAVWRDASSGVVCIEGEMAAELALGYWVASAETTLGEGIWDGLSFEITRVCEPFEVGSRVRFEPHKNRFRDWRTGIAWEGDALAIEIEHKLTRTRRWFTLEVDWASALLEINARARLRSKPCERLTFYDARIQAEFPLWAIDTAIEIDISEDGFDAATLELDDLIIAPLPWLSLDLDIERALGGKTLRIEPTVTLGEMAWIEFEIETHESIGTLRLTELAFDFTLAAIDFEAIVLADPDDWIDDQYAASLTLKAEADLPQERHLEAEIILFWKGASPEGGIARATLLARFEPLEWISAWLQMDIRSGSGNLYSIALGTKFSW